VDDGDRVTRWNSAAEQAFGVPADEALGRPLLHCRISWEWPRVVESIIQCRAAGHPTRVDDVRYRRPEGADGLLSITVSQITGKQLGRLRGRDGKPARSSPDTSPILILGSDITERRLLQMQLAQTRKLESIGQLAAGIAHEINTPVQFVADNSRFLQGAFADLLELVRAYRALRDCVAPGAPAAALATVEAAEKAADVDYLVEEVPRAAGETLAGVEHVAAIVRALRTFAHPGRTEPALANLNQGLTSTLTVARSEIKHVAEVETELGELPAVRCHPGDLNQVFLNLIVNAAHAIADVVGDSGRKGVIRVKTWQEGDTVVVAISDTGTGIPRPIHSRIFDPFFTTKAVGRGTGQGLAIAHAIVVDKHRGTLTFETTGGRGTTFYVRLPIGPAENEP
jgi:signal transduction histidine kinase